MAVNATEYIIVDPVISPSTPATTPVLIEARATKRIELLTLGTLDIMNNCVTVYVSKFVFAKNCLSAYYFRQQQLRNMDRRMLSITATNNPPTIGW